MATFYSNTNTGYRLRLDVTQTSQNVGANTSSISYALYLESTTANFGTWGHTRNLSINGTQVYNVNNQISMSKHSRLTLATGTRTIEHNSDGTKSIALYAWLDANTRSSFVVSSALIIDDSMTLTTIPRASQPTLNYSTRALGSAITISTNRASDSFTHTLTYAFGNQSGTIGTAKGVGASQSWTLPSSLASAIPNASSGTGTITCQTFNGSAEIGSKSVSFTATVPNTSTFQPTATISSIVEGASIPSGITAFVQNKSKAKVTSTGAGKYSATIKTYSVAVAGIGTYTGSVITSAFLRNSGSVRVTLTVTDSRGLKGSTYEDISVVAYSPPQISTFNASRSESTPANISVTTNASISSISSQNYKRFIIRSKASDGSWVVKTDSTQNYTFSGTETIVSDPDKSYTIEFFVQDSFTSITRTVQVGTAFTLIDFNSSGRGMAIGKVSESNSFEVGMPTSIFTTEANVLTLKRSSPLANVNLVFENDAQTRYISFKGTGRPAWSNLAHVDAYGYDFWTSENSNAMTDSGSNPNGSYVKFSDGTMICYHALTTTRSSIVSDGGWYRGTITGGGDTSVPFPVSFLYAPIITVTRMYATGPGNYEDLLVQSDVTMFIVTPISKSAFTDIPVRFSYIAIGRWK